MKRIAVACASVTPGQAVPEGPNLPGQFTKDGARELPPDNERPAQTPHHGPHVIDEALPPAPARSRRPRYCEG
jgi:hypothetical protein